MRQVTTAIAIAVGFIVLFDYFFQQAIIDAMGHAFVEWTIVLTAFAVLLGLGNLLIVHVTRAVRHNEPSAGYSVIVLITSLIVFTLGMVSNGPSGEPMTWVFTNMYVPLQGAMFALVAFFLATAAYRALRIRNFESVLLVVAALVVFLGQIPLFDWFADAKDWLLRVPSEAGVRGILLGVAIGTIATGVRLLVGIDRPYSE
jgi:hypothetical protein